MTDAICLCGKVVFLKGRHATLFIHLTSIHTNVNVNTNVTQESQDHVEKFFIFAAFQSFYKVANLYHIKGQFY